MELGKYSGSFYRVKEYLKDRALWSGFGVYEL